MDTSAILEYMVLGQSNEQECENTEVNEAYQSLYHLASVFFDGIVSGLIGIDEQHTYDDIALEWMPRFKKAGDQVRDALEHADVDEAQIMAAKVDEALQWKLLQMDESLLHIICAGYDVDQDEADERFNALAYKHRDWAERLANAMEMSHCSCQTGSCNDCGDDHCCKEDSHDHCCKDKKGNKDGCCKNHHDKHGECCQKSKGHHDDCCKDNEHKGGCCKKDGQHQSGDCCKNKGSHSQGNCHNKEKKHGQCCKDKGQQSGHCQKGNHQGGHCCKH